MRSSCDEETDVLGLLAWSVEEDEAGRLDAFLVRRLAGRDHSRTEIKGWIAEGRVRVSRALSHAAEESPRVLKASYKLKASDQVTVDLPPPPPPPEPLQAEDLGVPILHQDEAILVLNKPANLTVHPGAGQRHGTLVSALLHLSPGQLSSLGGEERPGIVHRLDKDTTGVIVVARTDKAHRILGRQFHDRVVSKRYLALTEGVPRKASGLIDAPLGRHPKDRKKQAVVEGGRPSRTHYEVRESLGRFALVECKPETGRTHQIRVHLKSLGTPIVADATYGRRERLVAADLGGEGDEVLLDRQALHAARLEITHPSSGERMAFEAPLPNDMQRALEAMRGAA